MVLLGAPSGGPWSRADGGWMHRFDLRNATPPDPPPPRLACQRFCFFPGLKCKRLKGDDVIK